MKKEILITVFNKSNKKCDVELLCFIFNSNKPNNGLPKDVSVSVLITEDDKPIKEIEYGEFLKHSTHQPTALQVIESTDNRRISFFKWTLYGEICPIVPQITPKGLSYYLDGGYKWDSKKHNIADTQEGFIMDGKEIIYLTINPKESFELRFNVIAVKVG